MRIVPIIDEKSYSEAVTDPQGNEIRERQIHYHTLHSIEAVVRRDVVSVEPRLFDRTQFELPALAAMSATLRQLRAATGIARLDVNVGAVAHDYSDEDGKRLPGWSTDSIYLDGLASLTEQDWREVGNCVISGKHTSLAFELVMDARRFLRQRDHAMAVLNAAIACEIHVNELVTDALVRDAGLTEKEAGALTRNLNNRNLLILVNRFYNLRAGEWAYAEEANSIDIIDRTFGRRNKIAHGDEEAEVSEEWAEEAIEAALRLANAHPKSNYGDDGRATGSDPASESRPEHR